LTHRSGESCAGFRTAVIPNPPHSSTTCLTPLIDHRPPRLTATRRATAMATLPDLPTILNTPTPPSTGRTT
jgi:hypothetical protein